jgi:HEAT repeat protein
MAARQVRRVPAPDAVVALSEAVRTSTDEFVRYRALVLLTGFEARGTPALMQSLMSDRNDRVREVVYRWFELHPDPALTDTLVGALATEQAEFVRPALVRAVAALDTNPIAQRALVAEAGRGLDFFRSAVIDALGRRRARYAVATLTPMLQIDGPLRDDVVLALGRIGEPRSLPAIVALPQTPPEAAMAPLAARCLLGDDCATRIAALRDAVTSRVARPETVTAGMNALSAIALESDDALDALLALTAGPVRDQAVGGLGGVALRDPARFLEWLLASPSDRQSAVLPLLKEAFERFEEDFAEEQFFAAARASYWKAPEASAARTFLASLIDTLEF